MKKSLMLLTIFLVFISSCKKDAGPKSDDTQSQLKGEWSEIASTYKYYNASGTKVYEETVSLGTVTFDGISTVTATYEDETNTGSYTLTKEGTEQFLTFTDGNESRKYTLVSISNTAMTLSLETQDDFYYIGSKKYTVDKSILTSALVKK
jgi:hypothetical protein